MSVAAPSSHDQPRTTEPSVYQIRDLIYRTAGIFHSDTNLRFLADRCGRRMQELQVKTLRAYLERLTQPGTGRDEMALLAVTYGKGRIFHTLLGRTADGLACVGFQTILQRGLEWAATGKVTQRIPTDFPREDKPSLRPVK